MSLDGQSLHIPGEDRPRLDDVSVALQPGEILVLVGPNGAGKSTLLRCLAGDLPPLRGAVHLDGQPVDCWSGLERARRVAVLPQQSALDFPFIVRDVVALGRFPYANSCTRAQDHRRVDEALARCRVEHLASRRYTTLSGGERHRVQLARVLAQVDDADCGTGRYLLLDEPVSDLDAAEGFALLELLKNLAAEGVGMAVTLHDLSLAHRFARRIVILHEGRSVADGRPDEVLSSRHLREVFGVESCFLDHPDGGRHLLVTAPRQDHSPHDMSSLHPRSPASPVQHPDETSGTHPKAVFESADLPPSSHHLGVL